ncbi:MAG: nitroreductase family protein [Acidimicrobiales bacterium]
MRLDDVLARRRMHRRFLPRPVEPEVVDRVLARASRAPSAGNAQGWDWLVLEGSEQTGRFWALDAEPGWAAPPGLLLAPAVVVPLADPGAYERRYAEADKAAARGPASWTVPYWLTDTAFATMLLLLGAVEEGLGAAFVRLHRDPPATLAAFGVPPDRLALGAVALGWPDPEDRPGSSARTRRRRPLADQVHRGCWGAGQEAPR